MNDFKSYRPYKFSLQAKVQVLRKSHLNRNLESVHVFNDRFCRHSGAVKYLVMSAFVRWSCDRYDVWSTTVSTCKGTPTALTVLLCNTPSLSPANVLFLKSERMSKVSSSAPQELFVAPKLFQPGRKARRRVIKTVQTPILIFKIINWIT